MSTENPSSSSLALKTDVDEHETKKDATVPQPQSNEPQPPHPGALGEDLTPPVTPTVGPKPTPAPGPLKLTAPIPESNLLTVPVLQAPGPSRMPPPESTKGPRVLEFPHDITLRHDAKGFLIELGRGVWSVVHEATSAWSVAPSPTVSTPPLSPVSPNSVLAVKSPSRRDAHPVLEEEARIMTRLLHVPEKEKYVVPFHGFVSPTHSIVMTAIPLTLSSFITKQATVARETFSTRTMFQPVLGKSEWLNLAKGLALGLEWLHDKAQVIHGDIKPHNILINPSNASLQDPQIALSFETADMLYADFSSSREVATDEVWPAKPVSALTPPYAAPEFLSLASVRSSNVLSSAASDVFSLAVTLVAASTGDLLLYPGTSSMQRLALAQDGHRVLEHVRSGHNGSRIPRNGAADMILKPAVVKAPEDRIKPGPWASLIQGEIVREMSERVVKPQPKP